MTKQEIIERVNALVADKLGITKEEIEPRKTLDGDLGASSIDCVELLMEIENDFGINIPGVDAFSVSVISEIYDLVERTVNVSSE